MSLKSILISYYKTKKKKQTSIFFLLVIHKGNDSLKHICYLQFFTTTVKLPLIVTSKYNGLIKCYGKIKLIFLFNGY